MVTSDDSDRREHACGVQNNGGVSASSMNALYSLASGRTRLFVSDAANSRVLVWDTIPTNGGAPATTVIGQPSFATNLANAGGPVSKSSLLIPLGLHASSTRLIIVDSRTSACFSRRCSSTPRPHPWPSSVAPRSAPFSGPSRLLRS